jgi:hypothetical protein
MAYLAIDLFHERCNAVVEGQEGHKPAPRAGKLHPVAVLVLGLADGKEEEQQAQGPAASQGQRLSNCAQPCETGGADTFAGARQARAANCQTGSRTNIFKLKQQAHKASALAGAARGLTGRGRW